MSIIKGPHTKKKEMHINERHRMVIGKRIEYVWASSRW